MIEERNGFECIDNDCMQCSKSLGNRKYLFIQAVWLDEENDYCVVSDIEDLTTMSLEDIESAITGYYDDIETMEKSYDLPLGQLDSVIAECNFEGRPFGDWEHQSEVVTWNRAEEIIQKFIDTDGEMFLSR